MDSIFNLNPKHVEKTGTHTGSLERAGNFRKNISANYLEILENSRLTLRKQKLDDLFLNKRTKQFEEQEKNKETIIQTQIFGENSGIKSEIKIEEKSINERLFNLSINKAIECLKRNQLVFFIEDLISKLNDLNPKNIRIIMNDQLKLSTFKLKNLLLSKDFNIPKQAQIKLYSYFFIILETYSALGDYDEELIFESLWSITNLCVVCPLNEIEEMIIKRDFFKSLEKYLYSKNPKVRELTIWCFGNLIGDSSLLRQHFINNKILSKILDAINDINSTNGITRMSMWLISQISKGKPFPKYEDMSICIVTVTSSLWSNNEEVIRYALQILTFLTYSDNKFSKLIFSSNCLKKLIEFAYIKKKKFNIPCIRILGNLLCLENAAEPLINNDILNLFTFYLTDEKNLILEDVVWCIKQLSDNSTNIVKKLLDNDIFIRSLIDTLFKPQVKQDIKENILEIIINIISNGDYSCIEFFLNHDIILLVKRLIGSYYYSPTLYHRCMLIIEKLVSYEELSQSIRNNIIKNIISLDFHNIFETIYFKYKNTEINQIIEKILNICNENNSDQMMY